MYCPNCASQNKTKQNYCRFCGLSLRDLETSYSGQLVFGEDTPKMQTFRSLRKVLDFAEVLLIVSVIVAFLTLYFSGYQVEVRLVPIALGLVFLFDIVRRIIRRFEQKSFKENNNRRVSIAMDGDEVATRRITELIEGKVFVPATGVTENSTQLLSLNVKRWASESE